MKIIDKAVMLRELSQEYTVITVGRFLDTPFEKIAIIGTTEDLQKVQNEYREFDNLVYRVQGRGMAV